MLAFEGLPLCETTPWTFEYEVRMRIGASRRA